MCPTCFFSVKLTVLTESNGLKYSNKDTKRLSQRFIAKYVSEDVVIPYEP